MGLVSDIRQAIYQDLVYQKIGRVYQYRKTTLDWNKYIKRFKDNRNRVFGADIAFRGLETNRTAVSNSDRIYKFEVSVLQSISDQDESELVFSEVVDALVDHFGNSINLSSVGYDFSVSRADVDERMFGDVLCHHAQIDIDVTADAATR